MRKFAISAFTLGTMFLCSPVDAAVTVFGSSDAQQCYKGVRTGRGDKEACDRALSDPWLSRRDRASTFVNRGILLNRRKRFDDAVADFDAALKIDPGLGAAFLNRGNSMFFRKRIKAAFEDYSRAIRFRTPELHVAYFNRALANEALGRIDAARRDLEKALELKPGFEAARRLLPELGGHRSTERPREAPAGR